MTNGRGGDPGADAGLGADPLGTENNAPVDEICSTMKLRVRVPHSDSPRSMRAALPTEPPMPVHANAFGLRARHDTPMTIVLPTAPRADRATLTVLAGSEPGFVVALVNRETIVGRSDGATIAIDEPSISRRHARIVHAEDGRYLIEDLGSRNGTFVNGARVRRVALESGDRIQLGRVTLFRFALVDEGEETLQRRLYESSTRDSLTGLVNRRCLLERLELELARGTTDSVDTGVLMIDVDHFKQINDSLGHLAGDEVLRALAMTAEKALRAGDLFGRYGGEEFVAIICDATKEELVALAERVRGALAQVRVDLGTSAITTTVSVGVALWSECRTSDPLELVALADERMYAAKVAGRNRVVSEGRAVPGRTTEPETGTR